MVTEGQSFKEECEFFRSYSLEIISKNVFDKSMQNNGKLDPNSIEYTSRNEYLFQRTRSKEQKCDSYICRGSRYSLYVGLFKSRNLLKVLFDPGQPKL